MSGRRTWVLVAVIGCAGCAGDDGGGSTPPAPDAPVVTIDAPGSSLEVVTPCPATPAATVVARDGVYSYMPAMTTIAAGQVVRFDTSPDHDVAPMPPMTDPGLVVGFNTSRCLRFMTAGTFRFKCTPHSFSGTITVQ